MLARGRWDSVGLEGSEGSCSPYRMTVRTVEAGGRCCVQEAHVPGRGCLSQPDMDPADSSALSRPPHLQSCLFPPRPGTAGSGPAHICPAILASHLPPIPCALPPARCPAHMALISARPLHALGLPPGAHSPFLSLLCLLVLLILASLDCGLWGAFPVHPALPQWAPPPQSPAPCVSVFKELITWDSPRLD